MFDAKRPSGLLAKPSQGGRSTTRPHRKSWSLLLAFKPRPQEPDSPHPTLSFMSATALPTPARFRPLGPPMFDSPTIAS